MTKRMAASVLAGLVSLAVAAVLLSEDPQEAPAKIAPQVPSGRSADDSSLEAQLQQLEKLRAIGYADFGPDELDSEERQSGVTVWDRSEASPGYNLYCSRITPEAFLMDMSGEVVHRWHYQEAKRQIWDHAVMLDSGELVVLVKFSHILRLDWDSDLVWRHEFEVHHDIAPLHDGTFQVLLRELKPMHGVRVRLPVLAHLSADGLEMDRWSGAERLEEIKESFGTDEFLDTVLDRLAKSGALEDAGSRIYDYFHANTITILPKTPLGEADARFREGNLMICFRNVHQVLILDRDDKSIVWHWGAEELERPHNPTMLDDGNILIFDNGTERKYSRVVEIEPVSGEVVWEYAADPPESFFTAQKGSAQRLPNGNTLVGGGDTGRAFEVTPEGRIVWEWWNPVIKKDRRESTYRMTRLAPDLVDSLLSQR